MFALRPLSVKTYMGLMYIYPDTEYFWNVFKNYILKVLDLTLLYLKNYKKSETIVNISLQHENTSVLKSFTCQWQIN